LICRQSRNIDIWTSCPDELDNYARTGLRAVFELPRRLVEFKSHNFKPPSILHTSREAREIGLNNYSLEFGLEILEKQGRAQFRLSIPSRVYVNWKCDTICPIAPANEEDVVLYELEQRASQLQSVAFDEDKLRLAFRLLASIGSRSLREMIIYWVPALESERIFRDFDAKAPFNLNFIPFEEFNFADGESYTAAADALQNAEDRLVEHMEAISKVREEHGEKRISDPALKFRILETSAMKVDSH
jgi:hypothetical protein